MLQQAHARIFLTFYHASKKRLQPLFIKILLKGPFHEPTNHDDERNKTADEWKLKKKIDRWEEIKTVADECLWSSHCTVLTDCSLADALKPMNSVSKDGRGMRYSTAYHHYLTCLMIWSFPPMQQPSADNESLYVGD